MAWCGGTRLCRLCAAPPQLASGCPPLGRGACRNARGPWHMTAPAIELVELRKNFGPTEIIRGVTLNVAARERHAIIGPNGAGKSTLFNLISGRLIPSSGT